MKTSTIILTILFMILFMSLCGLAQDINVHYTIGKKQAEVVIQFGKPAHQDNSNPAMLCMFYKGPNYSLIFVADKEGVFQAEANANYDKESKAKEEFDKFVAGSIKKEFAVDTVSTTDFHLHKSGVKVDLQMSENKLSKKFELRIKATKSES